MNLAGKFKSCLIAHSTDSETRIMRCENFKRFIFKIKLGYLLPAIHFLDEYIYSLPISDTTRELYKQIKR